MLIHFPYPQFPSIDIPDNNLAGVFEPKDHALCNDASAAIHKALAQPIASPVLEQLAAGHKSALIISDDYTRQTPVKEIIPQLVDSLGKAGIAKTAIRILVALGTHRPMTDEEKLQKFGAEICRDFEIINHNWKDEENLVAVGALPSGPELRVNRIVAESEFVIGLGQVVPHRIAGFSGGAKIILPGVCGAAATTHTHWTGGMLPGQDVLGIWDNVVRRDMNAAGKLAGLKFIVNAVCDAKGRLVDVFAGEPVEAHRVASELAREVFGVKIPGTYDVVIVDSFPKDIEMWQAAKALYSAEVMVKQGGVVILVSPCTEGVSRSHPLILEKGYKSEADTLAEVDCGVVTNLMVASHCLRVGRVIKDRATGILVSDGICDKDAVHLGFVPAKTPQDALSRAFEIVGRDASVAVLKNGGEALPVVG